jgi:hypothetical protein
MPVPVPMPPKKLLMPYSDMYHKVSKFSLCDDWHVVI